MSYKHTCQCTENTRVNNTNKATTEVNGIETMTSAEDHSTEGTSNSTAGTSDSKMSIGVVVAITVGTLVSHDSYAMPNIII